MTAPPTLSGSATRSPGPPAWRPLLYHVLGVPLSLLYLATLGGSFVLGLGLSVFLIGAFVLAGTLWLLLLAADLERRLGTALLGVRLVRRRVSLRSESLWDWVRLSLADAATYKALLYVILKLPFSLLMLALGGLLALSAALISLPLWWPLVPAGVLAELRGAGLGEHVPGWSLAALSLAGALLLGLSAALFGWLTRAWAFLNVALLTDFGEGGQARQELRALGQGARAIAPGVQQTGDLPATLGELLAQGVQASAAQGALIRRGGEVLARHGLSAPEAAALAARHPGDQSSSPAADGSPESVLSFSLVVQGEASEARRPAAELHVLYPGGEPPRRELEFWEAVAQQASLALDIAGLLERARSQGSEQERARLARELHDSVAQALYSISLSTRAARAQLGRDPARAAGNLDYAVQLADGATSEMKALLFALRPDALEEGGLVAALERLSEMLQLRYRLEAPLDAPEEPELGGAQKGALYRVAQEAAHNALKHARAGRVALSLQPGKGGWVLSIQDDGVGFVPGAAAGGTLGLRGMRERAAEVGGRLEVQSAPGAGTTVRLWLPRPPAPAAGGGAQDPEPPEPGPSHPGRAAGPVRTRP